MATTYLGPQIDIHGGGYDLVFPHHECEIAQAETATGVEPFVRYWMHVGMTEYEGEKMSKSLGNLVYVKDMLKTYASDAIRLYLHAHHYRGPWLFLDDEMQEWVTVAEDLQRAATAASGDGQTVDISQRRNAFFEAMDNDLDTPTAIDVLRQIAAGILEAPDGANVSDAQSTLRELGDILGLTLCSHRA
jgi:L-cysteine:1D-myo-inositol 2-amino-2-deoxy-alpha-D-glucopyranoside ligase